MIKNIKQIIVMRKDLNMRKGKMVAQGAHASMKVFFDMTLTKFEEKNSITYHMHLPGGDIGKDIGYWIENSFKKICCSVDSEEELLSIYQQAKDANLPCSLIQDAGVTEFGFMPTYTCCCIGPAKDEIIDPITGELPLL